MRYIAYRHVDGRIHVKTCSSEFEGAMIYNLADSDFVDDFINPYEAESRREAERIAQAKLSLSSPVPRDT